MKERKLKNICNLIAQKGRLQPSEVIPDSAEYYYRDAGGVDAHKTGLVNHDTYSAKWSKKLTSNKKVEFTISDMKKKLDQSIGLSGAAGAPTAKDQAILKESITKLIKYNTIQVVGMLFAKPRHIWYSPSIRQSFLSPTSKWAFFQLAAPEIISGRGMKEFIAKLNEPAAAAAAAAGGGSAGSSPMDLILTKKPVSRISLAEGSAPLCVFNIDAENGPQMLPKGARGEVDGDATTDARFHNPAFTDTTRAAGAAGAGTTEATGSDGTIPDGASFTEALTHQAKKLFPFQKPDAAKCATARGQLGEAFNEMSELAANSLKDIGLDIRMKMAPDAPVVAPVVAPLIPPPLPPPPPSAAAQAAAVQAAAVQAAAVQAAALVVPPQHVPPLPPPPAVPPPPPPQLNNTAAMIAAAAAAATTIARALKKFKTKQTAPASASASTPAPAVAAAAGAAAAAAAAATLVVSPFVLFGNLVTTAANSIAGILRTGQPPITLPQTGDIKTETNDLIEPLLVEMEQKIQQDVTENQTFTDQPKINKDELDKLKEAVNAIQAPPQPQPQDLSKDIRDLEDLFREVNGDIDRLNTSSARLQTETTYLINEIRKDIGNITPSTSQINKGTFENIKNKSERLTQLYNEMKEETKQLKQKIDEKKNNTIPDLKQQRRRSSPVFNKDSPTSSEHSPRRQPTSMAPD